MSVKNKHAEILLYDEIDPFWGVGAKQFAEDLRDIGDVSDINVRINSPGGDVFEGLAIFNSLSRHKASVTVTVDGLAASIASIIAMAGDTVEMSANAMMMIHNPWTMAVGDADEMRKTAATLEKITDTLIPIYANRTGADAAIIAEWMNGETWFDAPEAVEGGFADYIGDQVAVAASFDLARFRNAPELWNNPAADADDVPWRRMSLERKLEIFKRE
jgi:ATP-dependent Clp protease protease subunit